MQDIQNSAANVDEPFNPHAYRRATLKAMGFSRHSYYPDHKFITKVQGTLYGSSNGWILVREPKSKRIATAFLGQELCEALPPLGSKVRFESTPEGVKTVAVEMGDGTLDLPRSALIKSPAAFQARVEAVTDGFKSKRGRTSAAYDALRHGDHLCVMAAVLMRARKDAKNTGSDWSHFLEMNIKQGCPILGFTSDTWAVFKDALGPLEGIPRSLFAQAAKAERAGQLESWVDAFHSSKALLETTPKLEARRARAAKAEQDARRRSRSL